MRAFALRHGDRLSGEQVLAVLDDYTGMLVEDGTPICRERLAKEGRLEAFKRLEFQFQNDPVRFLATSEYTTVSIDKPQMIAHWTRGAMLLVGPALGLLPGLAMGQRMLGLDVVGQLLGGAGVDHVKWLAGRHDERRRVDRQQVVIAHSEPAMTAIRQQTRSL